MKTQNHPHSLKNKNIIQINPKNLEQHLWAVIEDIRIVNRILSRQDGKNQEDTVSDMKKLELVNAVESVKTEINNFEEIALKSLTQH